MTLAMRCELDIALVRTLKTEAILDNRDEGGESEPIRLNPQYGKKGKQTHGQRLYTVYSKVVHCVSVKTDAQLVSQRRLLTRGCILDSLRS